LIKLVCQLLMGEPHYLAGEPFYTAEFGFKSRWQNHRVSTTRLLKMTT
jgi:hypothetical protein